jgi:hypothetical protein
MPKEETEIRRRLQVFKQTIWREPTLDDWLEFAARQNRASDCDATIAHYEQVARKILQKAGLPDHIGQLAELVKGRELSPEWRAARVLEEADVCRNHLANSDAGAVVLAAMRLQREVDYSVLSDAWESAAQTGKRVKDGSSKGHERNDELHQRMAEIDSWCADDDLLAENGLNSSERARIIAKKHREKASTVRNAIWRRKRVRK